MLCLCVCVCVFVCVCVCVFECVHVVYSFVTTTGLFGPPNPTYLIPHALSVHPTSEDDLDLFLSDGGTYTCVLYGMFPTHSMVISMN